MVRSMRDAGRDGATPDDGSPARALRVSVLGPPMLFADRTASLLRGFGFDARVSRGTGGPAGDRPSRLARVRRGLAADVFMHLSGRSRFGRLQRFLAGLGVPTLIVWTGSDVVLTGPDVSAPIAHRAWHWCVAPWLRDELGELGVAADVVRLTPPAIPRSTPAFPREFTVLAYTIEGRGDLYGLDVVLELARRRRDVRFLLVGPASIDDRPSNVEVLGWVEDMTEIMGRTTVYLRPTAHDGLSNLVLEALAQGRYVLWTYAYPGVDPIGTIDAADRRIDELRRRHADGRLSPNHAGRSAVMESFGADAVRADLAERLSRLSRRGWRRSPGAIRRAIAPGTLRALRVLFRANAAWERADGRPHG